MSGSRCGVVGDYAELVVPSLGWPERYVLFRSNILTDQYSGGLHASEEDFKLEGEIKAVERTGDTIRVTITRKMSDTTVLFEKGN